MNKTSPHKQQSGQARLHTPERRSDGGQVLLLIVLVATVLLTIGLSVTRVTTEETRIAKLEADAKLAFAGAEAGLEAALQKSSGTIAIDSLGLGNGLSGTATIQVDQTPVFTPPLLQKDDTYFFYLSDYTPAEPTDPTLTQLFGTAYSGTLSIQHTPAGSDYCNGVDKHALELTFLNVQTTDNKVALHRVIDECSPKVVDGTVDNINYGDTIDLSGTPSHILVIRVLAQDAAFSGVSLQIANGISQQNWPAQGKTIISEAKTTTGVTKKIKLIQFHPQIPADFFVTSF